MMANKHGLQWHLNLTVDLLVAALAGVMASLLAFYTILSSNGQLVSFTAFAKVLITIFTALPKEYGSTPFELVIGAPVIISIAGILLTRSLVQRAESRSKWPGVAVIVAFTATVISTLVFFAILASFQIITLQDFIYPLPFAFVLCCFLLGAFLGLLLGVGFTPKQRLYKIIAATIVFSIVAGMFEFFSIPILIFWYS